MFDVKKLAKLLKEIFARDNENFSPELVADEIKSRESDLVDIDHKSDYREMDVYVNRSCGAHLGSGEPYGFLNGNSSNVLLGLGEIGINVNTDEPDRNEREMFHRAAVSWLAKQYDEWPASNRDWLFVNKYLDTGEWFMPTGITLSSGCVVWRSEWSHERNQSHVKLAEKSVIIGSGCTSNHKYAVVIGSNISSDRDYQLKIGSNDIQLSRDMTDNEYDEIYKIFSGLIGRQ